MRLYYAYFLVEFTSVEFLRRSLDSLRRKDLPMKAIRVVPHTTILRAIRKPGRVKCFPVPSVPYDAPMVDVEQSMRLTLNYLAACEPPFVGGKIERLSYGFTTAVWPLMSVAIYSVDEATSARIRTDHFLFMEARGFLFQREQRFVNLIPGDKSPLKSTHSVAYSEVVQGELFLKLEKMRYDLLTTKIPKKSVRS